MEKTERIEILLVEDDVLDSGLVNRMLSGLEFSHLSVERHVTCLADALAALEHGRFDAVLLDLNLPDSFGLDTFDRMHRIAQRIPVVIHSALNDMELTRMAMEDGAMNYLVKGEFDARLLAFNAGP